MTTTTTAAASPASAVDPQGWHRRPPGYGAKRCPTCNAPTNCLGDHRLATPETETHKAAWLARRPDGAIVSYGGRAKQRQTERSRERAKRRERAMAAMQAAAGPLEPANIFHYRPKGFYGKRCPICDCPTECRGLHRERAEHEGDGPRWVKLVGVTNSFDDGERPVEVPFGWRSGDTRTADADADLVTSVAALAKQLGVGISTVVEWKKDGMPWLSVRNGVGGVYRLSEVKQWRASRPERRMNRRFDAVDIGGTEPKHLAHLFAEHYFPKRLQSRCLTTSHQYEILFRHLARFLGRPPELWDLTEDVAVAFMAHLATLQSPVTVNKSMEKLVALWRFAARRGLVSTWPETMRMKEPKRIPQAWTKQQVLQLLAACSEEPGQVCGIRADRWWLALCLLLYYTGVRIGAAKALRWESVDLVGRTVLFPAETQKQFADQRFELPDEVFDALVAIREPMRELVFPWNEPASYLWAAFTKILRRAGLPADRKSKFHRLRRTSASLLKAVGGNPMDHLGHSGPAMTKRYLDPAVTGERSQCHLLPSPFPSKPTESPAAAEIDFVDWI